jgi:hypothetical protein
MEIQMVTVRLADGSEVKGELVKSGTKTPAKLAKYVVKPGCPTVAKGKQRQEVLNVIHSDKKREWTREDVTKLVTDKYPISSDKFTVSDSVGYHLHVLGKEGYVEVK